ncbi:MAG: aryl-sulfate sulfotransferase [Bacteroidota bacterium]|nr:aryl-sulfate sulfotransferase [Bacteroidota bacterium]
MYTKISLIKRTVFYLLCFSFFLTSCNNSGLDYTIKTILNPNKISPLTAILNITSDIPCKATVKVLGDIPVEQSFDASSTSLIVPVLGLYPNKLNQVEITLDYEGGQKIDVIEIQTSEVPNFFPEIEINKLEKDKMEPGMHALDIHFANFGKFRSAPIIFDDNGNIRWYLDLSFHKNMVGPFQKIKNGNILVAGRHTIYEFDMMGKLFVMTKINNNYGIHHDVLELPNEDLLLAVGKRDAYIEKDGKTVLSDSDFMIHFDRKQSKIVREWDLAKHLDVDRDELNFFRDGDWLHMNSLEFDGRDSTIIVSGRNQGLIKVTWDDKLKWIMSPKQKWGKSGRKGKGYETKPYLLTALNKEGNPYNKDVQNGIKSADDFDFPWGPHAPSLLPNGNIIVFDNGPFRNYNNENNYSRAVEYKVNDSDKTFEQIWEYGKSRGVELFSGFVSDVDFLPTTKNILMTSGFINPYQNLHRAKVVEVSPEDNKEVFEATIFFKNISRDINKPGWGQSDLLYRSERMELKN